MVPDFIKSVMEDLDRKIEPLAASDVFSAVMAAMSAHEPVTEEQIRGSWPERSAFLFRAARDDEQNVRRTHYAPAWTSKGKDGTVVCNPDIREADPSVIEHWKTRAKEARHPVLRARYADLVWDLTRVVTQESPDVTFARIAIDAYVEAVEKHLYKHPIEPVRYLQRALELALSVSDSTRTKHTKGVMLLFLDGNADPGSPGVWVSVFDCLDENRRVLTTDEEAKLIALLEEMLRRSTTEGAEFHRSAQFAADRLAKHYQRANQEAERHRVTRTYGKALELMARDASSTLGMMWLQDAYETYRDQGMAEDATRAQLALEAKGKDAAEEAKEIVARVTIPSDQVDAWIGKMTEGGLESALDRITKHFIPNVKKVREDLESASKRFLSQTLPVPIIYDGHFVAQVGSLEEDPQGRLLMQLDLDINLRSPWLSRCLGEVVQLYAVTPEEIVNRLYRSSLFAPDHKTLLMEGVNAYLQGDYVKAIHVLVPQIEHALLTLADLLGLPITKPAGSDGVMHFKNLNDILREEAVRSFLGDDIRLYLLVLLADARGRNLRNYLCHGLLPSDGFTRETTDQLIHVLLVLSALPAVTK